MVATVPLVAASKMTNYLLITLCFLSILNFSVPLTNLASFHRPRHVISSHKMPSIPRSDCHLKARSRRRHGRFSDHYDDDEDEEPESAPKNLVGIPQLPGIGFSSFGSTSATKSEEEPVNAAFVARKFQLQYTCNVCETRNCHLVSRVAYRNGVVITRCKGCQAQHLIADHLGWTDYKGGFEGDTNTIEDFFAKQGQNDAVLRVGQEVFDLEKVLRHNTDSGAILGDDGKPALE